MIRRSALLLIHPIACRELDELSAGAGQLQHRPRTQEVIDSDISAGWYLQDRFDLRWKSVSIPSLSYRKYTAIRRGAWDVFQKLRYRKLAGTRVYMSMLQIIFRLNFRADMAIKLIKYAEEDNVCLSSEMVDLLIRMSVGKEGGIRLLTAILRSSDFRSLSLSPQLITSLLTVLRNWLSPIGVFESVVLLTQNLQSTAIPYHLLISSCSEFDDATAIFNIAKQRGGAELNSVAYTAMLNACIRSRDRLNAFKVYNSIPHRYKIPVHLERLITCYKETDSEKLLSNVFNKCLSEGNVLEQHLIPVITFYGSTGNTTIAKQLYSCKTVAHLRDNWAVLGSLMTACAVDGDITSADLIFDSRPTRKKPLSLLHRYRHVFEVALLKAKYGDQPTIGVIKAMMNKNLSYPVVYRALLFLYEVSMKKGGGRAPFGIRACLRILKDLRETTNTDERFGKQARTDLGDVHDMQLDKLLARSAELQKYPLAISNLFLDGRTVPTANLDAATQFGLALNDQTLLHHFNNSDNYRGHVISALKEFGTDLYSNSTSDHPSSKEENVSINTAIDIKAVDEFHQMSEQDSSDNVDGQLTVIIDKMLSKEPVGDDTGIGKYLSQAWLQQTGSQWGTAPQQ
eukprot:TRINITY_DN9346_c0_g1_i1.p1 TRINITY_DN9346_c0_g1~~TRINITY_DN9346_c0_g1_i1.p1  ORF type:complete len:625 (+),score=103.80 TRINITY_DN9346_c0_g1_i1:1618-3492(+)